MTTTSANAYWVGQVREHFSELEALHFKKDLNSALKVLQLSTNYTSKESLKAIDMLSKAGQPISTRQIVGDHLAKEEYGNLFVKMWHGHLHKFITHDDVVVNEMLFLTRAVISRSPALAIAMGKSGALGLLLNQLKAPNVSVEKIEGDELVVNYVLVLIVIILLAIYQCNENRDIYRKANAISILNPYVQRLHPSEKDTNRRLVKLGALLTLSYILNESETKTLEAADVKLCVVFTGLIHANVKASISETGISTAMILDGVNQVALLNDTNKINFVKMGMVPLLSKVLKTKQGSAVSAVSFSEEEQILAARGLWNLSFVESNRKVLRTNTDVVKGLKINTQAENKTLRDTCNSALWEIFEGNVGFLSTTSAKYKSSEAKYKEIPSLLPILDHQISVTDDDGEEVNEKQDDKEVENDEEDDPGRIKVMISYQWDVQKSMLKLRDKFRQGKKISVWMDVDQMKGNILEAMAEAVEESDVVLVCLSRKYKESLNCRTEASYAYKLKKPVVPLMVEDEYVPDGWLGALLGVDLYYASWQEDQIRLQFPKIVQAIEEKSAKSSDHACKEDQIRSKKSEPSPAEPSQNVPSVTPSLLSTSSTRVQGQVNPVTGPVNQVIDQVNPVTTWSTHRVAQWLEDNDLAELIPKFSRIKGTHLRHMYARFQRSADSFDANLKTDLQMDFLTIVILTTALEELFTSSGSS